MDRTAHPVSQGRHDAPSAAVIPRRGSAERPETVVTYKPHLRLTMSGTIAGAQEQFSCSLSLEPHHSAFAALEWGAAHTAALTAYLAGNFGTNFEDLVSDCQNFWTNANSGIHALAVLKRVTLAAIGPDGRYGGAALESAQNAAGGASTSNVNCPPWQISRKITLETDGDLGRVKGGFYLPCPVVNADSFDPTTGLWTVERCEQVRDSVVDFLDSIANDPGFDVTDLRPCVASQGRHNKNGSVRLGPDNYEVKRVNVGRRPDVQRRRANKRTEARFADAPVSF